MDNGTELRKKKTWAQRSLVTEHTRPRRIFAHAICRIFRYVLIGESRHFSIFICLTFQVFLNLKNVKVPKGPGGGVIGAEVIGELGRWRASSHFLQPAFVGIKDKVT